MVAGTYTDYLSMLASKPPEKIALVDDTLIYTYGQLVEAASKLRAEADVCQPAVCGL